jgi:hypothetical protein
MLSVIYAECREQAHLAEYHYADAVMLNVVMLNVVAPAMANNAFKKMLAQLFFCQIPTHLHCRSVGARIVAKNRA